MSSKNISAVYLRATIIYGNKFLADFENNGFSGY